MKHKIFIFILKIIPKKLGHRLLYYKHLHKKLDLKNPTTLNEKVHWLELNYYGEKEGFLSDKNKVKDYIKSLQIKNLYIPKTYFTIKYSIDEIDYKTLPEIFVVKTNHGSGDVYILEKSDIEKNKKIINKELKLLKRKFSSNALEEHYNYIEPVVMFEEYLDDKKNKRPFDYKFFCYNGKVDCVMVCSDREKGNYRDFFDKEWNHLEYSKKNRQSPEPIERPKNIEDMFKIASEISKNFPFIRVDLYNINGKIYFSEMTFSPAAGLAAHYSDYGDIHLGSLLEIEGLKKGNR